MASAEEDTQPGWTVVGPVWSSVFAAFLCMKPLFLSAALASLLLCTISFYGPGWIGGQSQSGIALARLSIVLLSLFLRLLLMAAVAVPVHRFILLGERTPGVISLRSSHTRRFAFWLFAFAVIALGVLFVGLWLSLDAVIGALGKLVSLVLSVGLFVISIFSVLVFPSIAIGEPSSGWRDRLSVGWRRMDGHFWLFIGTSIAVILPIIIIPIAGMSILAVMDPHSVGDMSGKTPLAFGVEAADYLINLLVTVLTVAIASRFYARFRDQPGGLWISGAPRPGGLG